MFRVAPFYFRLFFKHIRAWARDPELRCRGQCPLSELQTYEIPLRMVCVVVQGSPHVQIYRGRAWELQHVLTEAQWDKNHEWTKTLSNDERKTVHWIPACCKLLTLWTPRTRDSFFSFAWGDVLINLVLFHQHWATWISSGHLQKEEK